MAGSGNERPYYSISPDEALKALDSRIDGLSQSEAEKRLERYGPNRLKEGRREPGWMKFLRQFTDVLVLVLIAAAVITAVIEPDGIDWVVITVIVFLNAIIGYVQESRAEEAIEGLKKLSTPSAYVIRGGRKKEVKAEEVVPGDIIYVESGMRVPADARIIEAHSLKVREAALSGESTSVEKGPAAVPENTPLAERSSMLYMTTVVETGHATAVVTATGMDTEIGHIASMIQSVERVETPLQKRLAHLGKQLGILIIIASAVIFGLEIVREGVHTTAELLELFEVAVSLAVAAIPEGLPAVVTISLAIGLKAMARRNAIVRKLPVVETLGSATVICTDKTGTLTTGIMTADRLYTAGGEIEIEGGGYEPVGRFLRGGKELDTAKAGEAFRHIMLASILCSDADIEEKEGKRTVLGDTTEGAVIVMAEKAGLNPANIRKKMKRLDEMPFDSERKRMSTLVDTPEGRIAYTKGAPEAVLEVCKGELTDSGSVKPLNDKRRKEVLDLTERLAGKGYRTLGFAYSPDGKMESDMIFLGIAGIRDQVRPEARDAVASAKEAGIRVIMITGDHRLTAAAIGKELGIIGEEAESINCSDLDTMDDDEFRKTLDRVSVYARAAPEHKVRIVKGLKAQGHIVAMTGDGVNDAPALKMADIGVAMGITGTDVSKEASDMILTDDNFASIVAAVEEGRGIYDNIKKAVQFLLSCNMAEVGLMLVAILIGLPLPLVALQILWMNLVTDSFPALALVTEPKEPDIMKRRPRDPNEGAITRDMAVSISISAVIITLGSLWVFVSSLDRGETMARTMALTTMVMYQMWTAISARSTTHTMSEIGWFSNLNLLGAIALSVALMMPVLYVPQLNAVFHTAPLGLTEWVEIIVVSATGLVVVEIWEWLNRRYFHYGTAGLMTE